MPAISDYEFRALSAIARGAHEAFLAAGHRPVADVQCAAGVLRSQRLHRISEDDFEQRCLDVRAAHAAATPITYANAVATASKEQPEDLADLADAYLTSLTGIGFAVPFNGAFRRAETIFGNADLAGRLKVIQKALRVERRR